MNRAEAEERIAILDKFTPDYLRGIVKVDGGVSYKELAKLFGLNTKHIRDRIGPVDEIQNGRRSRVTQTRKEKFKRLTKLPSDFCRRLADNGIGPDRFAQAFGLWAPGMQEPDPQIAVILRGKLRRIS